MGRQHIHKIMHDEVQGAQISKRLLIMWHMVTYFLAIGEVTFSFLAVIQHLYIKFEKIDKIRLFVHILSNFFLTLLTYRNFNQTWSVLLQQTVDNTVNSKLDLNSPLTTAGRLPAKIRTRNIPRENRVCAPRACA